MRAELRRYEAGPDLGTSRSGWGTLLRHRQATRRRYAMNALCGLRTGAEGETGVPVTPQDVSGAYRAIEGEV